MWIRTNEQEEAVAALGAFARFLPLAKADLFEWRWAILSLHTALQGFMVVAIRDSAGLSPLPDDLAAAWLQAYRCGLPTPEERLDKFLNLYKKIKRNNVTALVQGRPFTPAGTQGYSVKLLNRLRNQFVHFLPASWSLEVTGLPHMCLDCLAVIEYLSRDYRNLLWPDETYVQRIDAAVGSASPLLNVLKREYEGKAV
jgi:hypothetical protein